MQCSNMKSELKPLRGKVKLSYVNTKPKKGFNIRSLNRQKLVRKARHTAFDSDYAKPRRGFQSSVVEQGEVGGH